MEKILSLRDVKKSQKYCIQYGCLKINSIGMIEQHIPARLCDEGDIISGLYVATVYRNKSVQEQLKKNKVVSAIVEVFTGS